MNLAIMTGLILKWRRIFAVQRAHLIDICKKYRRIWLNTPINGLVDFLGHYLRNKLLHLHLRAVTVVPKWRTKPWLKVLRNFRFVEKMAATEHVFTDPTNDRTNGGNQDV
jgi:hypothetical protein